MNGVPRIICSAVIDAARSDRRLVGKRLTRSIHRFTRRAHESPCAIPKDNLAKSTVSPLMFMFVLKDLVVDMSHFYAQYKSIDPFLKRKTEKEPGEREHF